MIPSNLLSLSSLRILDEDTITTIIHQQTLHLLLRVVELVLEWAALLHRQGVRLPAELVPHHLEVAGDELLVSDVRGVPCNDRLKPPST